MLDMQEIDDFIRKLEYGENEWDALQKLTYLYTVRDHARKDEQPKQEVKVVETPRTITATSDSEFMKAIDGMMIDDLMLVVDELMTAVQVTNPRLYDSVMRRVTE